jgi:predicted site-specific integrase-resolvase
MSKQLVSIGKAADLLGVCVDTLREWDSTGQLVPVKTKGLHRRYRLSDIEKMCGDTPEIKKKDGRIRVATYSRVSSHEQKQKGDLERQSGRILKYCVEKDYHVIESFEEVGSGMKDDRPKLKRLFKLVEGKQIDKVIVEHKDRLARFMVQFLIDYFASYDVEIEWMSEIIGTTYEQELVEDILSLMSSFSNRIYGRRSAENRRARKLAEKATKEIKAATGMR